MSILLYKRVDGTELHRTEIISYVLKVFHKPGELVLWWQAVESHLPNASYIAVIIRIVHVAAPTSCIAPYLHPRTPG